MRAGRRGDGKQHRAEGGERGVMDNAIDLQRQFYEMLARSQYWSATRMQEHQRSQLGQLLRHARKNVPFYESRLDAVFRPDGEIDWDRWPELPILTRQDLQQHRESMQARELPPGHGPIQVSTSSGSTGEPIVTTHSALAAMAGDAAFARGHSWHGVDYGETLVNIYGDNPERGVWPDGTVAASWGPRFLQPPRPGPKYELNLYTSPTQQLDFIRRYRPAYVGGLTSRLKAIALEAKRQGADISIRAMMTFGEAVPPATGALFREAFGTAVIAQYSTQETNKIAMSCPTGGHYHVNAETCLVEIVDDQGEACESGVMGRVLVTSFFNTAQPLIRYQLGDLAVAGTSCRCGRTLPVLSEIRGRIAHLFMLPDGRRVLPNVSDDGVVTMGVRAWQLAQVARDMAEFRYVPGDTPVDEAALSAMIRPGVDANLRLTIRQVEQLGGGRKHIPYVSELADQAQ
jgi:phenylacetate-CoA ligase